LKNISLRLKSVLSQLEQINFKSYFLRTNSTWGQLRSEELTPARLETPKSTGVDFLGLIRKDSPERIRIWRKGFVKEEL